MNTTQLECFVQVAGTLNFVRAAQNLNLSQPALSKQIMSLERELGVKLLDRSTRSVKLTVPGQRFLQDAEFLLQQIRESKQRVLQYDAAQLRKLRVGYSDAHELQRIGLVFSRMRKTNPLLQPVFELGKRDANLSLLKEQKLDVVFALKDDMKLGGGLRFLPLFPELFYAGVTAGHPLARRETLSAEEVRHYPQILCVPYNPVNTVRTSNYLRTIPLNAEDRVFTCGSCAEAYSMALSELGVAILPKHLIVPFPALRLIPITDSAPQTYGAYFRAEQDNELLPEFLRVTEEIFNEKNGVETLWPEAFRAQLEREPGGGEGESE